MSTTTAERAKLGYTRTIPHGLLPTYAISVVGNNLHKMAAEIETKADATDHVVLWNTLVLRGFIEPDFHALGFRAEVEVAPLDGLHRADVLEAIFERSFAEERDRRRARAMATDPVP